jgi:hypothetical protein
MMARQFAITIEYIAGHIATLFWHDNDTVEFITVPPLVNTDILNARGSLLEQIVNTCKKQKLSRIEVDRLP